MKVKARECPSCERLIKYPESEECWYCGSSLAGATKTRVSVTITDPRPSRRKRHRPSRFQPDVLIDDTLHREIEMYRRWRAR